MHEEAPSLLDPTTLPEENLNPPIDISDGILPDNAETQLPSTIINDSVITETETVTNSEEPITDDRWYEKEKAAVNALKDISGIDRQLDEDSTATTNELAKHQDTLNYLEQRPYVDTNGITRGQGGEFVADEGKHFDREGVMRSDDTVDEYAKLNIVGEDSIQSRLADAEARDDKTTKLSLEEEASYRLTQDLNSLNYSGEDSLVQRWAQVEALGLDEASSKIQDAIQSKIENALANPQEDKDGISQDLGARFIDKLVAEKEQLKSELLRTGDGVEKNESTAIPENEADADYETGSDPDLEKMGETERKQTELENELRSAVVNYAAAKIDSEKLFYKGDGRSELDESGLNMDKAFKEYMNIAGKSIDDAVEISSALLVAHQLDIDTTQGSIKELESRATLTDVEQRELTNLRDRLINLNNLRESFSDQLTSKESEKKALEVSEVIKIKKQVEEAIMLERNRRLEGQGIKASAKRGMAKFNDWMKKNPTARIGIGLGMAAAGVAGTVTGFAPAVGLAFAGSRLLSGTGIYNLSRGIGDTLINRRYSKAEALMMKDYLNLSAEASDSVRKNKVVSALAATAIAIIPGVYRMIETQQHFSANVPENLIPKLPTKIISAIPKVLTVHPAGSNLLPWSFVMDKFHENLSNPKVLDRILNNKYGIKFIGNNQGAGLGRILSVHIPGKGNFTDSSYINGALEYVLGSGGAS